MVCGPPLTAPFPIVLFTASVLAAVTLSQFQFLRRLHVTLFLLANLVVLLGQCDSLRRPMPFDGPYQMPFGDIELLMDARSRICDRECWVQGRFQTGTATAS